MFIKKALKFLTALYIAVITFVTFFHIRHIVENQIDSDISVLTAISFLSSQ